MSTEKALALVLRTTDWSESSRIATLWTREFGKVRGVAKGGRRLRSNFESALDLLTLCSIVLLRKSSGAMDLLTEARVVRRFPLLRSDLGALYASYYVAELLADWTEENDPHPALFDEAVSALEDLGTGEGAGAGLGPRVARFELVLLRELGHVPVLDRCVECSGPIGGQRLLFSPEAGGTLCPRCQGRPREARPLSAAGAAALRELAEGGSAWRRPWDESVREEVRQVLGLYVTYVRGRRPRLLPYLGS